MASYRNYRITIAAGASRILEAHGQMIELLSNSASTDAKIRIGNAPWEDLPQGIGVRLSDGKYFDNVELQNPAAAVATIEVAISSGQIFDYRNTISGTIQTNDTPDVLETPAAIAVTTAAPGAASIAANAARREILIQNNGASPMWAGDANVDGANNRGIRVDPGADVVLKTSADIYLRSTGGNTTASYMDLRKA